MAFDLFAALVAIRDGLPHVRGPARAVLYALATRADGEGKAWPSASRLASDSGFGVTAVGLALAELERDGLLEVTRRHGWPSVYRLRVLEVPLRLAERVPGSRRPPTSPGAGDPLREPETSSPGAGDVTSPPAGGGPRMAEPTSPGAGEGGPREPETKISSEALQGRERESARAPELVSQPEPERPAPPSAPPSDPDLGAERPIDVPHDLPPWAWEQLRCACVTAGAPEPTRDHLAMYRGLELKKNAPLRPLRAHVAGFEVHMRRQAAIDRRERESRGGRFVRDEPKGPVYPMHRGYQRPAEDELVDIDQAADALAAAGLR